MIRTMTVGAAIIASAAAADPQANTPDPAPAIVFEVPERPHLVDGALYWADHALAGICDEFGGSFSKLQASTVYRCTSARLAVAVAATVPTSK